MGNISEDINGVGALEALAINDPISIGGNQGDEGSSMEETQLQKTEKDPRTIARKYQIELCDKALVENVIVYLETGCGKTHIAVLLIYKMRCLMKKPRKDICIFLAPTVALVEQQAKVIKDSIDVKVGIYCGSSNRLKFHRDWEQEMEQFEVFVMTPQILLHNLSHCFIKIENIALLIFDECHYAQVESDHPYAEIMKIFYKPDVAKLPRIFGMTASPIFGKGASINSLETLLHAKVYTVKDREELDQFVSSPIVNVYYYGPTPSNSPCPHASYSGRLESIKAQVVTLPFDYKFGPLLVMLLIYVSNLSNSVCQLCSQRSRILQFLRTPKGYSSVFMITCCFVWKISAFGEHYNYLSQVAAYFAAECKKDCPVEANGTEADLSSVDALGVPFFSLKLLRLVGILSSFRAQPDMKCIIFVNRIITARSLAYVLHQLRFLSAWRCSYLVGVHSGLKNMSRKTTNAILEKFRSGELNLLVATKVGEEGLDIQTCCLVIRFDLPETVASFIQSRGRARMPQSEYAFLVDRGSQRELNLIQNFCEDEAQMNNEITSRTSTVEYVDFEEKVYRVDSTGATIGSGSSVSLLHRYCSKLPHDEFFNPKPWLYYFDDAEGTVCHIILPPNAPIHQIISSPQPSREAAKKDACLKACQQLYELGALTHYLLPDDEVDDNNEDDSDSDGDDEESSRRELHEMLVPSALRERWIKVERKKVSLSSYFIKFSPSPADRLYKEFGLFLKAPIPQEAERMKLDLQLARGRSVMTEIVPCGASAFSDNEIVLAEWFQEMWLKAIIDKSEFVKDFVQLGKDDVSSPISTFYLLLPVIVNKYRGSMTVDWKLITKCLSSPIFRTPKDNTCDRTSHMNNCLYLSNGPTKIDDILNSLVYVPCKDTFYFVSGLFPEKDAFSLFKEETNYANHFAQAFGVKFLHPYQPLLKAKQLFRLDNLLRKRGSAEPREKEEHFVELPPEICVLKVIGFSRDIGSSLSLLPSVMHRLESNLVAIELRRRLSASFSEGSEVSAQRVLEALTTERCNERFSLERLEVLGDAFLKFAVGRHLFVLHNSLDEGQLTRKRSNMVNNSHLFKLALSNNLHVYVRDQSFEPSHFYPFGRRCSVRCTDSTQVEIHSSHESNLKTGENTEVRCDKGHHWLQKKTVADVVEALVGAFIVDSGFKAAIAFLKWIGIQVDFKDSHVAKICHSSKIFTALSAQIDIPALENLLGYQFHHKGLLLQAFLHPSYHNNYGGCYQRLEFLGDAVLDYLTTSYLYSVYPNLKPGQLTDLRSLSVNNNSFARIAVNRSFYKFMLCDSSNLIQSMNKYAEFFKTSASENILAETVPCPKALGDLVESCVGAILLDSGFNLEVVWKIMISFLDPVMKFSALQLNPIRELQELCQFYNWELTFPSVKKDGVFSVDAVVDGKEVCETACATNSNKKTAKRIASQKLYLSLKEKGYKTKVKSLEEILKLSQKMEARLIGYDEIPSNIDVSFADHIEDLKSNEVRNISREVQSRPVNSAKSSRYIQRMVQPTPDVCNPSSDTGDSNSQATAGDGLRKSSAKSHLYEICAINCWKPPLFECFEEMGPAHLKQFAFKVTVTIEEASSTILECIGDHRAKKKDAAEFAAQGVIWYLKKIGHLEK
ncbi:dicer-like protein 4 isoform X2 [Cynara cardunculus var. scolymus]|uniref:dicer-like protein 4 isoform X2 n=1 Tax=Cynara cardunculus var. scolymus TaxID=59895 RepID=UPI000D629941|nr:dicer-like protein 4 isoform X2 [Cynara cardunculus var. scolymus]